jgi:protein-disulfide isomerase
MFRREIALFIYLIALTVVLAGADVTYFRTADGDLSETTSAVEAGATGASTAADSSASSSASAARAALVAHGITSAAVDTTGGACEYDAQKPAVDNPRSIVGFQDPTQGNQNASVIVVEYFDPNCPHCATFHQEMKQVIESHGDEALFVYKPVPLWPYSVNQIQALYAAAQEGKFVEMMEAQFARQQRGGLNVSQLQSIAREIGMDPGVLKARIDQGRYMEQIQSVRTTAREIGVSSTPTVLVNGRFVAAGSRTAECLAQLIEGE